MKNFFKILIIAILLLILIYVSNITTIPRNIILFEGEKLNLMTVFGIKLTQKENNDIKQVSTSVGNNLINTSKNIGHANLEVSLFNTITVKELTVDVIPKTKVVPIGKTIGLKLYTKGVLVVGMSEVTGENADEQPYLDTGIEEGDTILSINEKEISSTEDLIKTVNESKGKNLKIEYSSKGEIKVANIKPSKSSKGEYKLGLWVRDAAAGVGTITFYEPSTKSFAALGHGIQDIDTGNLITISSGEIVTASIVDITKGKKGVPR